MNFDTLQVVFWSITYILVIAYSISYKSIGIPAISLSLNFSWETIAIFNDILYFKTVTAIHIIWFSLDLIIILLYFFYCKTMYFNKIYLIVGVLVELLSFFGIFNLPNGMLLLSFGIDLFMAIEWLVYSFSKSFHTNWLSFVFCVTKLVGDLFAGLFYKQIHIAVSIIGILVLWINVFCLFNVFVRWRGILGKIKAILFDD